MKSIVHQFFNQFPAAGAMTLIFNQAGDVLESLPYGYTDPLQEHVPNQRTRFGIASLTKSMTALIILQMCREQRISLDQPVVDLIPNLVADRNILICHLLSHSAGYYPQKRINLQAMQQRYAYPPQEARILTDQTYIDLAIQWIIEQLNEDRRRFGKPGSVYSYSNDSYALLSEIIRRYDTPHDYRQSLSKRILLPNQMSDTLIAYDTEELSNISTPFVIHQGQLKQTDYYDNASVMPGVGSVKSCTTDMIRYVQAFMNRQPGDLYDQMIQPYVQIDHTSTYGYGLTIIQHPDRRWIGHSGSLPGVSSCMLWDELAGIGTIILCNTEDIPVSHLARVLLGAKTDCPPYPGFSQTKPMAKDRIEHLQGHYLTDEGYQLTISDSSVRMDHHTYPLLLNEYDELFFVNHSYPIILTPVFTDNKLIGIRYADRVIPKQL